MHRVLLIFALLVIALQVTYSQNDKSFGIAFYNVDNLYDTLPCTSHNDKAYTPRGSMGWSRERYRRKIANITQVIDSMSMPVVALYGVENEQVVRDIVQLSNNDYAYLHKNSSDSNGLDFALLYQGDRFFPNKITPWQGALCIEGEVGLSPLTIIISHGCKSLGVLLNSKTKEQDSNIIILGSVGKLNFKKLGLHNTLRNAERQGRGNRIVQSKWKMQDYIVTNIEAAQHSDVYVRGWMIDSSGKPKACYKDGKYIGGYSSWLPIFIYFDKIFAH